MYQIKVSSVTNAQRARKLCQYRRIKAQITRMTNPAPGEGCGYVLLTDYPDSTALCDYLRENGVRVLGVSPL